MFDPVTRDFLASAPSLPGLPSEQFAEELTSFFVEITTARLSLREAGSEIPEHIASLSERMERIANVLEAQVILEINPDRVRPAAFVAASARLLVRQINSIDAKPSRTRIDEDVISPEIAATLLFMIAERPADAYEASRLIKTSDVEPGMLQELATALRRLARGQLSRIATLDLIHYAPESIDISTNDVSNLLYRRIIEGLVDLAKGCLTQVGDVALLDEGQSAFRQVRALSVDIESPVFIGLEDFEIKAPSTFPGPHYLASLLDKAAGTLKISAIKEIKSPGGVNQGAWESWIISQAKRFPFLWENHRKAIATGYLSIGRSLVMTSPTGSGKTTLATLKIAAVLTSGKSVVYLAPTHALVSQVERDLNARLSKLARATSVEDTLLEEIGQRLPDLSVITPERCFALLTFAPELFVNVGLLVFDECHMLGLSRATLKNPEPKYDRRSIDAMLCLLTFAATNQSSDYLLLSAMISNGADVAEWVAAISNRPCDFFGDKWKPTRQLKACITYNTDEISVVRRALFEDFKNRQEKPKTVPASVKELALGIPYGLFSLEFGWHPGSAPKFALRRLAESPFPLNVAWNPRAWRLTANRNDVAARLAARFAAINMKTIVFCESIPTTISVARKVNSQLEAISPLENKTYDAWRIKVADELGNKDRIYDAGNRQAAVHHGELLPEERLLVEAVFRDRKSGVNVLAATSTLAQGLNLPCDVVILAGTDRIDDSDPSETTRSDLQPHEILNALGRSGRAGFSATGLAIVVPANPVFCDVKTAGDTRNPLLAVVFSDTDQCLPLGDPISNLFDQIVVHGVSKDETAYLLQRVALSLGDPRVGIESFDALTRRSFGYFTKAKLDREVAEGWLSERRAQLELLIEKTIREEPEPDWISELAAKSGASTEFISSLAKAYSTAPVTSTSAPEWTIWLLKQLPVHRRDFDIFVRPDTVERVFGRGYTQAEEGLERRERARSALCEVIPNWFAAVSLYDLELSIVSFIRVNEGHVKKATPIDKRAKRARRFAIRQAPDIGYLAGVLMQVVKKLAEINGEAPLAITQILPHLIRRGFFSAYHLYLDKQSSGVSRQKVNARFASLSPRLRQAATDDWPIIRDKVDIAILSNDEETVADFEAFSVGTVSILPAVDDRNDEEEEDDED